MSSHPTLRKRETLAQFDRTIKNARCSRSRSIKIYCHIRNKLFLVNVGRGRQSIKWLANACSLRYYQEQTANGRLRTRERYNNARELLVPAIVQSPRTSPVIDSDETTNDIVTGTNSSCIPPKSPTPIEPATFLPKDIIRDVLADGDHIYINCDHEISCDHGCEITAWQKAAFMEHPEHLRRVKRNQRRVTRKKKPKAVLAEATSKEDNTLKNLFTARHEQCEEELMKRCQAEFDRSKIRYLVPKEDLNAVFNVLCDAFHEIEEIYMFFSTLDNGPINTMSGLEFNEFVRHCGLIELSDNDSIDKRTDAERERDEDAAIAEAESAELAAVLAAELAVELAAEAKAKANEIKEGGVETKEATATTPTAAAAPILKKERSLSETSPSLTMSTLGTIFAACNIEKDAQGRIIHDSANSTRELLRYEFLEAIVRLALSKYKNKTKLICSEKCSLLIQTYIQDYAAAITDRSLYLRERLSSNSILEIFHLHLAMIRRVYKKYCTRDRGQDKKDKVRAAELSSRRNSNVKDYGIVLVGLNMFLEP